MMYKAILNHPDAHHVVLSVKPEGTYLYVFREEFDPFPYRDYLQNDIEMGKRVCKHIFGLEETADWTEIPDSEYQGLH